MTHIIISFQIQLDNIQHHVKHVPGNIFVLSKSLLLEEYPISRFLFDVGGSFGLFLGLSIASLVGLTERLIRTIWWCIVDRVTVSKQRVRSPVVLLRHRETPMNDTLMRMSSRQTMSTATSDYLSVELND